MRLLCSLRRLHRCSVLPTIIVNHLPNPIPYISITILNPPPLVRRTRPLHISNPTNPLPLHTIHFIPIHTRIAYSLRPKRAQIHRLSHTNIHAFNDTREYRKRRFGLVHGHEVAGVEDAGEGQVAELAHVAADVGCVYDDGCVGRGGEGGGVCGEEGGEGEGVGLAGEPVADYVTGIEVSEYSLRVFVW
jgi:hypothetical protein